MRAHAFLLVTTGIVATLTARGQSLAAFDVASIRPSPTERAGGEGRFRTRIEYFPQMLRMWNVTLRDCVQWAYGVRYFQISARNLDDTRYDVLAKTAAPVAVSELRLMLQDLLSKRFDLAVHRESRTVPVYELVIAKHGPKLPAALSGGDLSAHHAVESLPRIRGDSFVFAETSLPEFAEKLSELRGIDRPVLDKTEIKGFFDIELKSAAAATAQDDGSLFGIIEQQLGLKLVSAKKPVGVLVIDHAERPSAN